MDIYGVKDASNQGRSHGECSGVRSGKSSNILPHPYREAAANASSYSDFQKRKNVIANKHRLAYQINVSPS
jgi:hypothetical protein